MIERITVALLYGHQLHVGGVESHLLALLRHGDARRFRWLIAAPVSSAFAKRAKALGGEVIPWRPRSAVDLAALIRLLCILRDCEVGLVHAHDARSAVLGRIAARLLKLPVVVTVHLPSYYYIRGRNWRARLKRRFYILAEKWLNRYLTDKLIYVSHSVHREALSLQVAPRQRSVVIENGVELEAYTGSTPRNEMRRALATPQDATVICFVGRLDYQKGVDVLLDAFHLLGLSPCSCRLWLVGDGPWRKALEEQVSRLALEEKVHFLGYRGDVPDILGASDLFVLPSRYEAMPVVLLEAMAAGLPCVVTAVGDNSYLIEDGVTGRLVSPEDPTALAEVLEELISDPLRRGRMKAAARQKVQNFTSKNKINRIEWVYHEINEVNK